MPHPAELSAPFQAALFTTNFGQLYPVASMDVDAFPVIAGTVGTPSVRQTLNVTSRLGDADTISLTITKPVLPTLDDLFSAGRLTLSLVNPDEFFAAQQNGAALEAGQIEQATVEISAFSNIAASSFLIFSGRSEGAPTETFGSTRFGFRDVFWEAITKPVLFDRFDTKWGPQNSFVDGDVLRNDPAVLTDASPTINPRISRLLAFDGYVTFDESGRIITTVTNSQPDQIVLTDISVLNGARLGKYRIEFRTATTFDFTAPDGTVQQGDIYTNFSSSGIVITPRMWEGTDGKGAAIEFTVNLTMIGNPVTIAMLLIERALLGNQGADPGLGSSGSSTGLPVDWPAFWKAERLYRRHTVYVSETNTDNKVWQKQSGSKPLNYLSLAQRVLSHIGCFLTRDLSGNISLTDRRIFDSSEVSDNLTTDSSAIIGTLTLEGQRRYNVIRVQYGQNGNTGNYGGELTEDLASAEGQQGAEEIAFQYPYFKTGISDEKVASLKRLLLQQIEASYLRISAQLTPNWTAPAQPGDYHLLTTAVQPRLTARHVQVYQVTKTATGSGFNAATVKFHGVPAPAGSRSLLCSIIVGGAIIS